MNRWGDTSFAALVGIGIMVFLIMTGCGLGIKFSKENDIKRNFKIEQHE